MYFRRRNDGGEMKLAIILILCNFVVLSIWIIQIENKIKELASKLDSLNIKVEVYHEDCKR
jgi:hypothetical protein